MRACSKPMFILINDNKYMKKHSYYLYLYPQPHAPQLHHGTLTRPGRGCPACSTDTECAHIHTNVSSYRYT